MKLNLKSQAYQTFTTEVKEALFKYFAEEVELFDEDYPGSLSSGFYSSQSLPEALNFIYEHIFDEDQEEYLALLEEILKGQIT